jgi:adenylyltransferase/sulfurtransferase
MDNFPTRFLLNQSARRKGIPFVHGSIWGLEGRLTFIQSPETPCLQCIFPVAPPKEVFPVLGAVPGMIGCLQAIETLKFLTGVGENFKSRLLIWNGIDMDVTSYPIRKDPNCPACGNS